jgi:colanic acid biosynthesis glycosyl transferase WcaI
MNIVLLTSIFTPEPIVSAQTSLSLARELTLRGHHVTVITSFPSRPAGKLYPGYKRYLYKKERHNDGFDIIRCFSIPSPKSTIINRSIENITFGFVSAMYLLFLKKVDALYSNTWLIFASGLMSLVARVRKIPYVLRIVDLYPESLVSQKRSKPGSVIYQFVRTIDQWIARGAASVVVLTKYFEKTYIEDRKIPASRVIVIPDWVDGDLENAGKDQSSLVRNQFGIPENAFLAAFGGNIGVAAGVDTLIQSAALVPDIQVIIAGDGSELSACKTLAQKVSVTNVHFFSPWPKEQTMALYQAADVLVVPTRGEQSIASIPSKLIRYMLAGRPIIAASVPGTELEYIVNQSQCGWIVRPDDPNDLAQALDESRKINPEDRIRCGINGREFAIKNLTENVNLPKLIKVIEGIP